MIKELSLPDRSRLLQFAHHSLTGPFLPPLHEGRQCLGAQLRRTKEVDMIRHDDIAADRQAMAIMRVPPFVDQDTGNVV